MPLSPSFNVSTKPPANHLIFTIVRVCNRDPQNVDRLLEGLRHSVLLPAEADTAIDGDDMNDGRKKRVPSWWRLI